ncbi:MAG TPA: hypothetical protein PLE95_14205 [Bacteroidales bacterium]|nr:hypothetical protein [Bacteroidales bacterium]
MKKILFFSLILLAAGLISCQKHDQEAPGNIKGMGNTPGELQVQEPYTLPEGIHLIGDITGIDNPAAIGGETKSPFIETKSIIQCFGSGRYVRLQCTLLNTSNYPRTVFFPKGLLWQCRYGDTQHGLQAQTTWACLQPNSSRTIYLDLYCLNAGIPAPDHNSTYKILGVTSSPTMWTLLNLIGWRMINYEMIYGIYSGRKGYESVPSYEEITERLQTIVHNLTDNGVAISAEDKAFIESIPELAPEEIPVVDPNSKFPDYFDEFVFPGK